MTTASAVVEVTGFSAGRREAKVRMGGLRECNRGATT
jgi:hypothetical protein